jgi:hypothetical protein
MYASGAEDGESGWLKRFSSVEDCHIHHHNCSRNPKQQARLRCSRLKLHDTTSTHSTTPADHPQGTKNQPVSQPSMKRNQGHTILPSRLTD